MQTIRSLASQYGRQLYLLSGSVFRTHEHVGSRHADAVALRHRHLYSNDQQAGCNHNQHSGFKANKERSNKGAVPPSSPPPPFNFADWFKWALGSVLMLILPFWNKKWKSLLKLEGEVEMAAEVVETAADVVEKIAMVAENVSSEIAHRLPEDGKLKDAVLLVEHVSKEAAEEAHLTKDIIHKVDELKQDVELLLEPIIKAEKHSDTDGQHQK